MSSAPRDKALRHGRVRRVLYWTLAANLLVVAAKVSVGIYSGSLAILAEAAQSSVDALSNVIALALMAVARRGPDPEHPYGHAKFETVGAMGIAGFLSITVFEFVRSAAARLISGVGHPHVTGPVLAVMVASAAVSAVVSILEARRGRALQSDILIADAAHTRADFYAALTVLAGLILVRIGYPRADAAVTLLIAGVVAVAGWRILQTTVPVLVDRRAVDEGMVRGIALATDGVLACYDVRSRGREGDVFAELTIAVERSLNVEAAHAIADRVERRVAQELSARKVVVHVEPYGEPKARTDAAVSV